ncbi:MAG: hypothetical protein OEV40_14305 [Acidimicrobiia bacterium]|nr:hypothetical protein [Acidimicrobiia bacterium]
MLQKRQVVVAGARLDVLIACVVIVLGVGLLVPPASSRSVDELPPGRLGGVVAYDDGDLVAGVAVDVFTAQANGGRDRYLGSTTTAADGSYRFPARDGCYVVVLVAPAGEVFVRTGRSVQVPVCLVEGRAERTVDGLLRSSVATLSGRVTYQSGQAVAKVAIDLFHATGGDGRTGYLASTSTEPDGSYTLAVPSAGCYRLVLIAPEGNRFDGGASYDEIGTCLAAGDRVVGLDAVVDAATSARIGGRVADETAAGAEGVAVDLFAAAGDGSRGAYQHSTTTGPGGRYGFDLDPGCYVLVLLAPAGRHFVDGGAYRQLDICAGTGDEVRSLDGTLAGARRAASPLSPVELEIIRLTNELRASPSGLLARRAPMPACVDEPFYDISLDPISGHPEPVPPLAPSEVVAVEMARDWAIDMHQRQRFLHRPSTSQQQIYDRLGIDMTAWGENIAWFSGFPPADAARIHFEGWRESETGHYCSLVTGRFTHVGAGELRVGDQSWAVQNFYAPR